MTYPLGGPSGSVRMSSSRLRRSASLSSTRLTELSCDAGTIVISSPFAAPSVLNVRVPPRLFPARQLAANGTVWSSPAAPTGHAPVGRPLIASTRLPRYIAIWLIMTRPAFFDAAISAVVVLGAAVASVGVWQVPAPS